MAIVATIYYEAQLERHEKAIDHLFRKLFGSDSQLIYSFCVLHNVIYVLNSLLCRM